MTPACGPFIRPVRTMFLTAVGFFALTCQTLAETSYDLSEPSTDTRVKTVTMQVTIGGQVITSAANRKELTHDHRAVAEYQFRERRLTGAGRDAEAFRSLREFETASMTTSISNRESNRSLPRNRTLVAVQGRRSGMLKYSPQDLLTREELDLLDVPGDPLALVALLPTREVELEEEWEVPDWAVQMLATLEAASTAEITARLVSMSGGQARVEFKGRAEGARLGAVTEITFSGHLLYDLDQKLITAVDLTHAEKGAIGTITPGIDSEVRVLIERSLAARDGALTEEFAESVPLEPPGDRLPLRLDAPSWGLQLFHSRGWHVFHANFDSDPRVVILRLVDEGTLICQCNFSPVADAAPGEHTPLDEYEDSIQQSLGPQFKAIVARDEIPTPDGRKIFRVTTQGKFEIPQGGETKEYPMSWIYYLCVAPSGKQVSFVFAVEPSMKERLAGQDRQIVESLQFAEASP